MTVAVVIAISAVANCSRETKDYEFFSYSFFRVLRCVKLICYCAWCSFLLAFLFSYASESFCNSIKTHTLGAGQFVEFILTREWNEAMKIM